MPSATPATITEAVQGGLYPHVGTQQLQCHTHGNPGWNPGYTGYGAEGDAPATNGEEEPAATTPALSRRLSGTLPLLP